MGVAVEIVSLTAFIFLLPVSVAASLNSVVGQRREMSDNVDSVIYPSQTGSKKCGWQLVSRVISSRSKVIAANVLTAAILDFR